MLPWTGFKFKRSHSSRSCQWPAHAALCHILVFGAAPSDGPSSVYTAATVAVHAPRCDRTHKQWPCRPDRVPSTCKCHCPWVPVDVAQPAAAARRCRHHWRWQWQGSGASCANVRPDACASEWARCAAARGPAGRPLALPVSLSLLVRRYHVEHRTRAPPPAVPATSGTQAGIPLMRHRTLPTNACDYSTQPCFRTTCKRPGSTGKVEPATAGCWLCRTALTVPVALVQRPAPTSTAITDGN
jgi:hypothetical protein